MSIQAKYQSVLNLGQELGAKDGAVTEANGVLTVTGTVHSEYEKNLLWDQIKEVGGATPTDIIADIKVETTDYYAKYTVADGDTLGSIAKHFYGEPKKYTQIFKANLDVLEHPDRISTGQVLAIPFEQ
jgi:nucleoid-associated protein YgaU